MLTPLYPYLLPEFSRQLIHHFYIPFDQEQYQLYFLVYNFVDMLLILADRSNQSDYARNCKDLLLLLTPKDQG